jgi:hypothetical protein
MRRIGKARTGTTLAALLTINICVAVMLPVLCSSSSLAWAADGPLLAEVYPTGWFEGDCAYHAVHVSPDGKVYFTVSSHMAQQSVHLYQFDPINKKLRLLWTADRTIPADGSITQGKVHSPLSEWNGEIYLATHDAWYYRDHTDPATGKMQKPYPGGYVIAVDKKTGRGRVVAAPLHNRPVMAYIDGNQGVPMRGESLIASVFDTKRSQFYALSWPSALLVRVDVRTGRWKEYGPVQQGGESVPKKVPGPDGNEVSNPLRESVIRTLALDNKGNVYGSNRSGHIWKYDAAHDKIVPMKAVMDTATGQPIPEIGKNYNYWRTILWDNRDKVFYGVHWATSWLFKFDPVADKVTPIRPWRAASALKDPVQMDLAQLGLAMGPHHTLFGLVHANRVVPEAKRSVHLISYDLDHDVYRDYQYIMGTDGSVLMFNESCAVAPNGDVYTVGWVLGAPTQREELKAKRAMGPPETRGYGYQMALVRIPAANIQARAHSLISNNSENPALIGIASP